MKKLLLIMLILVAPMNSFAQEASDLEKPKLVILLAIDQFPSWYLDEYSVVLDKGFRTLTTEGRFFPVGLIDHAPTLSGAGHGSLGTGSNPSKHGFPANEWWAQLEDGTYRWQSIFEDQTTSFVGLPGVEQYSPKNLIAPPISEWFLAENSKAKVLNVGISEVTVLYAARAKGNTFWYSNSNGVFGSSTYYMDQLPTWVSQFNQNFMAPHIKETTTWDLVVPEEFRSLAAADARVYENDGQNFTFPHGPADNAIFGAIPDASFPAEPLAEGETAPPTLQDWFAGTPYADLALLELAKAGIVAMDLGGGETSDLLTIAMGASDGIGHNYGAHSLEVLDYLVRLDAALAEFITFLDERYGRDGYVLGVSSDHGSTPATEYTIEQGGQARRISFDETDAVMDDLEIFITNYEGERSDLAEALAKKLEEVDFIENAMTRADLEGDGPADEYLALYRRGHLKGKTTDFPLWGNKSRQIHPALFGIEVQFKENMIFEAATTIHGSPYRYDREVPILFLGYGVSPGVVLSSPNTIDLAPTLAFLAGVPIPEDVDGKVLEVSK